MWFRSSVAGTTYLQREDRHDRHPLPVQPHTENMRRKHVPSASNSILPLYTAHIYSALLLFLLLSSSASPLCPLLSPFSASITHLLLPSSYFPFSYHPPVFSHSGRLQMVGAWLSITALWIIPQAQGERQDSSISGHTRRKYIHTYTHTHRNHITTLHQTIVFAANFSFQVLVFYCFTDLNNGCLFLFFGSETSDVILYWVNQRVPITGSETQHQIDPSHQ